MASRGRAQLVRTRLTAEVLAVLLTPGYTAPRRTVEPIAFLRSYPYAVAAAECLLTLPARASLLLTLSKLKTSLNGLCPALQPPSIPIAEGTTLAETVTESHWYRASRIAQGETVYP